MLDTIWTVEVDSSTSAEWAGMLDLFSDANIYQTWSYGSVRWGAKNLSHIVLKRNSEVVAIAQLRIIRPTRLKFGMAYLRWGPAFERRGEVLDPTVLKRMARALEEEYVERRRLLLHILPNAFAGSQRAELVQSAFSGFKPKELTATDRYRTLLLDISPAPEELRKKLDKKWRNQLSRAEKNDLNVIAGAGSVEFQMFSRIYREMRERKGFESSVDIDEFAQIQENLPERHRLQILICQDGGKPVAGLVASACGDSGIYLLGATSDSGLSSKGAYLLQWTLIQWLKERGCKWYDLGGIDPQRNPGVYHFKSGLSGQDVTQLSAFAACNSTLSSAVVRTGLALQRSVHRGIEALQAMRPLKQLAARS